jgi:phenylpropionate dioxygenase-like ring-hydroxylating dioxygenase large terminal subunit
MTTTENQRSTHRRPAAPRRLLPKERYLSQEFLEREFDQMWSRVWQVACLDSDVPNVGDYYEYMIGRQTVLVVRRSPTEIHAFHNACQHRGRRIKEGRGNSQSLQCVYHGWTWDLDGSVSYIPDRGEFCPFADADVALRTVRVERWGPFVFVNLDPAAGPLAEHLGDLPEQLAPYHLQRQYKWFSKSTVVRANWKNVLDAFQENYHTRMIHPESGSFVDGVGNTIELIGDHSVLKVPFGTPDQLLGYDPDFPEAVDAMEWTFNAFGEDTSIVEHLRQVTPEPGQGLRDVVLPLMRAGLTANNIDISELSEAQLIDDWEFFVFPNIEIHTFAFGSWIFRIRPLGTDPEATVFDMWYLHRVPEGMELPPPVPHEQVPEGQSCGAVMDQDFRNLPHQQVAMHSDGFTGHRISTHETRIWHMNTVLDRYLDQP